MAEDLTQPQDSIKSHKTEKEWREVLTPIQFEVTRKAATERPFTGEFYNFYEPGTYYCVCCNHKLFDSDTKFSSGCGWPSFFDVTDNKNILLRKDPSLGMIRTEVLCANCEAHLGHLFNDGPPPTGLRYCINSAALIFKARKD